MLRAPCRQPVESAQGKQAFVAAKPPWRQKSAYIGWKPRNLFYKVLSTPMHRAQQLRHVAVVAGALARRSSGGYGGLLVSGYLHFSY